MENINSDAGSDNTLVNVTKLTNSQKVELSKYTLSLINSARSQLGKKLGHIEVALYVLQIVLPISTIHITSHVGILIIM